MQILRAFLKDDLPMRIAVHGGIEEVRHETKRLRNSQSFKDLENKVSGKFRLLPAQQGIVVCLRRDDDA